MATQPVVPQEPEVKSNEPEKDPETGKFIYTYQPRDAEGQFIGKPYKYLYTDHADLIRQLQEGKEMGDRYIYEIKSGKRKLQGIPAEPVTKYEPAPESTEEVERKRREEFRKTAEQEFGAPLETVRKDIKESREIKDRITAYNWALNKEAEGYYPCKENAQKIGAWLTEKNLKACPENYDMAFEELKDALVAAPQVSSADSTQQQAEVTPTPQKPRSTGIIPGQFGGTRPASRESTPLTRERYRQIDKLSRDQWNKLRRTNPKEADAFLLMKQGAANQ